METTAVYREEQKMWIKIKREREREAWWEFIDCVGFALISVVKLKMQSSGLKYMCCLQDPVPFLSFNYPSLHFAWMCTVVLLLYCAPCHRFVASGDTHSTTKTRRRWRLRGDGGNERTRAAKVFESGNGFLIGWGVIIYTSCRWMALPVLSCTLLSSLVPLGWMEGRIVGDWIWI